ncbi:hypothetical protein HK101_011216 [Irineochytrium annulatum]|nr:hypothetical protein HK101_011216 [Irineochytrium annulatum]
MKTYDCLTRWSIVGNWISGDKDCLNAVITTLCRGITLVDRDNDFSLVSGLGNSHQPHSQHTSTLNGALTSTFNTTASATTNGPSASSSPPNQASDRPPVLGAATSTVSFATSGAGSNSGISSSTASVGGMSGATATLANHFASIAESVAAKSNERRRAAERAGAGGSGGSGGGAGGGAAGGNTGSAAGVGSISAAGGNVRANNKLFHKRGLNTLERHNSTSGGVVTTSSGSGGVSTGTKDGGVGLPTFATLTSEIGIKAAAETAMAQIVNYLGCSPPFGEVTGISRVSAVWNEQVEARRISLLRERIVARKNLGARTDKEQVSDDMATELKDVPLKGSSFALAGGADMKKYLRYFVYDDRVIIGILEQPSWVDDEEPDTDSLKRRSVDSDRSIRSSRLSGNPTVTLVLRDATGRYSWVSSLKYKEDSGRTMSLMRSSVPTPSATHMNLAQR